MGLWAPPKLGQEDNGFGGCLRVRVWYSQVNPNSWYQPTKFLQFLRKSCELSEYVIHHKYTLNFVVSHLCSQSACDITEFCSDNMVA